MESLTTANSSRHQTPVMKELVYSAVVVKDGKKTTVKTTAQTSSTSDTVQPAEGMVYSAVIRQDGKKTSVKVTVE